MISALFIRRQTGLAVASLLSGLSACGTVPERPAPGLDAAAVKGVSLRFEQTRVFDTELPTSDIAQQIADNLDAWGYVVGTADMKNFSHTMTVSIGSVKRDATPQGLSFSAGNSNPRALDFQKADILPVRCALSRKDLKEPGAELGMHVSADDYAQLAGQPDALAASLVDDMSTACFNLLEQLRVKTRPPEATDTAAVPGWVPEIRIETDPDHAPLKSEPSQTMHDQQTIPNPAANPDASQDRRNQPPRKRIIIHNQGSPVTFTLGHERK